MVLLEVVLLLVGFGAAIVLLASGQHRLGWMLIGVGVVATLLTFVMAGLFAAVAYPVIGVVAALRSRAVTPVGTTPLATPGRARAILAGAAIGVVPGVLIIAVPVLLHTFDVITSDQSQIAFIGMPIALIGLLVGAGIGATRAPRPTAGSGVTTLVPRTTRGGDGMTWTTPSERSTSEESE